MTLTAIPPLDRTSPTFKADVDAFFATKIQTFISELNVEAAAIMVNVLTASSASTSAASSAAAAAAYANATRWAAGSYGIDVVVWSPTNGRLYRKKTATSATVTDPGSGNGNADPANWNPVTLTPTNLLFLDKGNSGTAAQALDFSAASHQRLAVTGAFTLSTTGWSAAGQTCELLLELVNGAAFVVTWPTINWVKADGTTTTSFASNGVTLQAAGTDWVLLWTRDGGATIYGRVCR